MRSAEKILSNEDITKTIHDEKNVLNVVVLIIHQLIHQYFTKNSSKIHQ